MLEGVELGVVEKNVVHLPKELLFVAEALRTDPTDRKSSRVGSYGTRKRSNLFVMGVLPTLRLTLGHCRHSVRMDDTSTQTEIAAHTSLSIPICSAMLRVYFIAIDSVRLLYLEIFRTR